MATASTSERRKPNVTQYITQHIIPVAILAVLGWLALQFVEFKVDISGLKTGITDLRKELTKHNDESKEETVKNAVLHHRGNGVTPCNGCHDNGRIRK